MFAVIEIEPGDTIAAHRPGDVMLIDLKPLVCGDDPVRFSIGFLMGRLTRSESRRFQSLFFADVMTELAAREERAAVESARALLDAIAPPIYGGEG